MPTVLKTPGVYVEEISKFPPSVAAVATAIPAFVGYTEKAENDRAEDLTNRPTRISSLLEYQTWFGGPEPQAGITVTVADTLDDDDEVDERKVSAALLPADFSDHTMYHSLQAYFANGGGPCWIVSVGGYGALSEATMEAGLDLLENEDEPTLIVFPEQQGLAPADQYALINAALMQCEKLQDRFVIADFQVSGEGIGSAGALMTEVDAFRGGITASLKYGAAYFPNLQTIFDHRYDDTAVTVSHPVTAADGTPAPDGDFEGVTLDTLEATEGQVYAQIKQAITQVPVTLPPSGAVAGVYARVDANRGVWKSPANEGVVSLQGLSFKVTDEIQENLNVDSTAGKSINAIRSFTGRGNLIWGARTLDGNSNEWRYVSVRRFFNMVEESSKKASGRFVFEPNDANTWVKVKAMIENFLLLQWRAGALAGAKPEDAFFVKIGLNETMTALDILEGRMIVEIGMAVVRPAEFILLKFSHKMQVS